MSIYETNYSGFTRMTDLEYVDTLDKFEAKFNFTRSMLPEDWPAFQEPAGSLTWNISSSFSDLNRSELFLSKSLKNGLIQILGTEKRVAALDLNHDSYWLDPLLAEDSKELLTWAVPAIPDGDYFIFLTQDLKSGWIGHPWEQTISVYGELVNHVQNVFTENNFPLVRKDGKLV